MSTREQNERRWAGSAWCNFCQGDHPPVTCRTRPRPTEKRELLCEDCGFEYMVWFAPNELWNRVMRDAEGDEKDFLCPTCFTRRADVAGVEYTAFELRVEQHPARPAPNAEDGK